MSTIDDSTAAAPTAVVAENTEETEEKLKHWDPLLEPPSDVVREGDHVILVFGDGRQMFAQCVRSWKGKTAPVKINKRSYSTAHLIGLPYGTVLEVGNNELKPLPDVEGLIPEYIPGVGRLEFGEDSEINADDSTFPEIEQANDNRNLVDNNNSQSLDYKQLTKLVEEGTDGSAIVSALVENSKTFENKTEFSKAKYIVRKQKKYQPRCRMVRCTGFSVCETMFKKEPRKMMNMREDTLGQILSYSNISAGCQVLVMETCLGLVTGAITQRMGGYGKVISVYSGQQPSFVEMIGRFNLSFAEQHSIKWLHTGDIFSEDVVTATDTEAQDPEKVEREALIWPCTLQGHTRAYLETMKKERARKDFLAKRCARFARKLTRHTGMEAKEMLLARKCDSIVLATRYDPTATLLDLLPYLTPSAPFVVYSEYMEPLVECFRELQKQGLAINLRLMDTWMREYQVLPGRTHPNMNMSQCGGFLLTGIKLCPVHGHNELDDNLLKELRGIVGGRRGRKTKHKSGSETSKNGRKKSKGPSGGTGVASRDSKRNRPENDEVTQETNAPSAGREAKRSRAGVDDSAS
jgi:tRNA (adenine-N(1)-)-methyltransferase non-catalytic subunit